MGKGGDGSKPTNNKVSLLEVQREAKQSQSPNFYWDNGAEPHVARFVVIEGTGRAFLLSFYLFGIR